MIASFNRFEIEMTLEQAQAMSHSGDCEADVKANLPNVKRSKQATAENVRKELDEYGSWDETELADDEMNWARIVWLAAGNIKDDIKDDM